MAKKITIYKSNKCGACAVLVPEIRRLAKEKKIRVQVIDVDKCHSKKCDAIGYVPKILVDGREVRTGAELKRVFGVT